jgi:hypothetical protein
MLTLSGYSLDLHLPMEDCVHHELPYSGFPTQSLSADSAALSSASALSSSAACLAFLSPN